MVIEKAGRDEVTSSLHLHILSVWLQRKTAGQPVLTSPQRPGGAPSHMFLSPKLLFSVPKTRVAAPVCLTLSAGLKYSSIYLQKVVD